MAEKQSAETETVESPPMDQGFWREEADDLITFVWRQGESSAEQAARKVTSGHAYVCQIIGAIDPEIVRRACGGGSFRLMINKGRAPYRTRFCTIEAPVRRFDSDAAAEAAKPVSTIHTPSRDPLDAAQLATIVATAVTEGIKAALPALAPAAPAQPPLTFENMLALAKELRGDVREKEQREDPIDVYARMKPLFDDARREAGSGRSIGDAIAESMPHLVEMVDHVVNARVTVAAAQASAAARIPAARAVEPAAPVKTEASGAAAGDASRAAGSDASSDLTFVAIADQVARALRLGTEAPDFADVVEAQFAREEIALVVSMGAAHVTTTLRAYAGHFPELASEAVRPFVEQVFVLLAEGLQRGSHASVIESSDETQEPPAVETTEPPSAAAPAKVKSPRTRSRNQAAA